MRMSEMLSPSWPDNETKVQVVMGKGHENQTDKPLGICERSEAFVSHAR